jgi:hypothetical protein
MQIDRTTSPKYSRPERGRGHDRTRAIILQNRIREGHRKVKSIDQDWRRDIQLPTVEHYPLLYEDAKEIVEFVA